MKCYMNVIGSLESASVRVSLTTDGDTLVSEDVVEHPSMRLVDSLMIVKSIANSKVEEELLLNQMVDFDLRIRDNAGIIDVRLILPNIPRILYDDSILAMRTATVRVNGTKLEWYQVDELVNYLLQKDRLESTPKVEESHELEDPAPKGLRYKLSQALLRLSQKLAK